MLLRLSAGDVCALGRFMLELQQRADSPDPLVPQLSGDLEIKLDGHEHPVPVRLNEMGIYEILVTTERPQSCTVEP